MIDFYRKGKSKHEISLDDGEEQMEIPDRTNIAEDIDRNLTMQDIQKNWSSFPKTTAK